MSELEAKYEMAKQIESEKKIEIAKRMAIRGAQVRGLLTRRVIVHRPSPASFACAQTHHVPPPPWPDHA
jgi:hypothetical protein